MKFILTLILLCFFWSSSNADTVSLVKNTVKCDVWTENKNNYSHRSKGYVDGLINGMIMGYKFNFWSKPTDMEPKELYLWLDDYCSKNPSKNILNGIIEIFEYRWNYP